MPDSHEHQYKLLAEHINNVEEKLVKFIKDNHMPGKVVGGVVSRQSAKTGYISCFPHSDPAEEGIEGIIDAIVDTGYLRLDIEVAWSDGAILSEMGRVDFLASGPPTQLDIEKWAEIETYLFEHIKQTLVKALESGPRYR